MSKPTIVFRVDGGTTIGMGHITRCIALADMLKNDFRIEFVSHYLEETIEEQIAQVANSLATLVTKDGSISDILFINSSNDIIVIDNYNFKTEYQQAIKNKGCKLVVIDDLHAWHQLADVVINHAEGIDASEYSAESYTKFCLGLDYVLLRKPFLQPKTTVRKITSVKKVFISMGAADINNITQKFTEALLQINGIKEIHLMLGSINPNLDKIEKLIEENRQIKIVQHFNISAKELAELLSQCDVSICPASSISLESCAIGIGLISGFTAENQLGNLKGMEKRKTLINFGDMNLLTVEEIKTKFTAIAANPEQLNKLIENQSKMIDGKSPERLLKVFKGLIQPPIHFRLANESDTNLYFDWANDELVRKNSFNQNPIVYENHVNWFHSKLNSKDCFFYLFLNEVNIPVGQVRIDKTGSEIITGISIDKAFRGKSLGLEMLLQSTEDYLKKYPTAEIVAYIKVENTASYTIFKKAGFGDEKIVTEPEGKSYKLFKRNK